jgi:hypothetical protein
MPFLWGEYYFDMKTKKISKKQNNEKQNVMFVDFILKNLVTIYDKLLINPVGDEQVRQIIERLELFDWESVPLHIKNSFLKDR